MSRMLTAIDFRFGNNAARSARWRRRYGDLDVRCPRMPEDIGHSFLNDAIDGQLRRFADLAKETRNRRFDRHFAMRFAPHPYKRVDRLAQAQFGQSDWPQSFKHPPVELLQRIDLVPGSRYRAFSRRWCPVRAHRRSSRESWRGLSMRIDRVRIRHAIPWQFPCARHPARRQRPRPTAASPRRRLPELPQDGSVWCRSLPIQVNRLARPAYHRSRIRYSSSRSRVTEAVLTHG